MSGSDESKQSAVLGDWDRPLDIPRLFAQRHNEGGGRGNLGQPRTQFFRLSRAALDDLVASVAAGRLSDRDCLVVLSLATRAGYTAGAPGLVLGTRSELADAIGVDRARLASAVKAAEALGILDDLPAARSRYFGVRFAGPVYMWLTGQPGGARPPGLVSAADRGSAPAGRRAAGPQPAEDRQVLAQDQDHVLAQDQEPEHRVSRYAGDDIDPFALP